MDTVEVRGPISSRSRDIHQRFHVLFVYPPDVLSNRKTMRLAECARCRPVSSTKEPYVAMEDHGICGVGIRCNWNSLGLRSTQHGRFLRAARIHRAAREPGRASGTL